MADADLATAFNLTLSFIDQLSKALVELKSHRDGSTDTVSIVDIIKHFRDLEANMKKKYTELEAKEKAFKQEEHDSETLLASLQAVITAKEQDMFDRIQILKDSAVSAIIETREIHVFPSASSVDIVDHVEKTVSPGGEIMFDQELTKFCNEMDTNGLLNFVTENQKNSSVLCEQLSHALTTCTDPFRLVLDSLDGFYPLDDNNTDTAMRRSCIILIEAVNAMSAKGDVGVDHLLTYEIKQRAKAIADEWWRKLGHDVIADAGDGNSIEAEAFLRLLSAFKIGSEFADDELCKLVFAVCEQTQAPELCRSLGLAHKMSGVIEELIKKGKLISAVHFVHAFDFVNKFQTVPLLKTYLKDLRRNSQIKHIKSRNSASVQSEENAKELAALKSVIYCVEKYDLEDDYPLEPLHRRVGQLERSNPANHRKRFRESPTKHEPTSKHESPSKHESTSKHDSRIKRESTSKRESNKRPPSKKPRSNVGGFYGNHSPAASYLAVNGRQVPAPVYMDRSLYPPPPYNYQPPPRTNQATYSQRVYEQSAYYYRPDDKPAAAAAAAPPLSAYENTYYLPPDDRVAAASAPLPSAYESKFYYPPDNRGAALPPQPSAYENAYYYPPDDTAAATATATAAGPTPPPHAYVPYHASGVPSSYQPYM
ncbi:FRIGIDA-like protein 1 [Rutidosis leptorrhynchoides]|uniref:FRIGIDA-like protein 1 n=1 Tax=Rutidosis leptorrhynchoides TaxID=125765 RepID=UPI003A9A0382